MTALVCTYIQCLVTFLQDSIEIIPALVFLPKIYVSINLCIYSWVRTPIALHEAKPLRTKDTHNRKSSY